MAPALDGHRRADIIASSSLLGLLGQRGDCLGATAGVANLQPPTACMLIAAILRMSPLLAQQRHHALLEVDRADLAFGRELHCRSEPQRRP